MFYIFINDGVRFDLSVLFIFVSFRLVYVEVEPLSVQRRTHMQETRETAHNAFLVFSINFN